MKEQSRLGTTLVDANLITPEQLQMAVDFQKEVGGKLGAIIVKLGFIEEPTLMRFIAEQAGIPVVNLDELVIPQNLVKRIPRKLIEKHYVLPIQYADGVLTVAISDPYDFEAIEELQLAQDARIAVNMAPRSLILKAISQIFEQEENSPPPSKERPRKELREALNEPRRPIEKMTKAQQLEALVPLLLQKGLITQDELLKKSRDIEAARER